MSVMRLYMTKEEIRSKYNRAEDKKAVVRLLAELEGTDEATIRKILEEKPEPEPETRPAGGLPKKKMLTQRERSEIIRTMLRAGKSVRQIAEEAGCTEETVKIHARKLKLEVVEVVERAMREEPIARRREKTPAERVASVLLEMPMGAAKESKLLCYELCCSILRNAEK